MDDVHHIGHNAGGLQALSEEGRVDKERGEAVKWLYVCNKAGDAIDCGQCVLGSPNAGFYILGEAFYCRFANDNICVIRYRDPLEVAILKEIARQRKNRPFRFSCASHAIKTLWRVLKEGRKA